MILPKFEYYSPRSLDEAVNYLSEHEGENVKILGGGTDLLVDIRQKVIPNGHRPPPVQPRTGTWQARHIEPHKPATLMALSRIPELHGITQSGSQITIGAMTLLADLERSDLIREHLTGLWDGAYQLGSPLVRNRGTYGGNLCNARPAADTAIPTLALGGKLVLKSVRGERVEDHNDFVLGPGKTVIKADEILSHIVFDLPFSSPPTSQGGRRYGSSYIKLANRKSLEISVVGAAAAVVFNSDGTVVSCRVSLGAVAPKPLLIEEVGEALVGKQLTAESAKIAEQIAADIAKPITDHRGSLEYRSMMVEVLTERALLKCRQRAFAGEVTV